MKGQGSIELIVIVAFVAGFIVFVVAPWFSEAEYSLALASGRIAAHSYAEQRGFTLKELAFNQSFDGKNVTILPRFSQALTAQQRTEVRAAIYANIANTFLRLDAAPGDQCLQGPTKRYCVIT